MTQGCARPPKAHLVLRVGITGHRWNKLGEPGTARYQAVADAVRDSLLAIKTSLHKIAGTEAFKKVYADGDPLLRIISALAEGADRIAAAEAVAPCSELQVILPFAGDEYERDFKTDASKEEFRALMARAKQPLRLGNFLGPWGTSGDDGVGEDEQFASAGDQHHRMRFAALDEGPVECLERRVPAEGGRQCRGVERAPEPAAGTSDVRLACPAPALLDEWREAGERRCLFSADRAQFGHAQHEGKRGAFTDPGNAEHELEAPH